MGERDGEGGLGHDGQQRGVKDVPGNGPPPSSVGGGAVAQTRESGGAQATRRCATDRWGRVTMGHGSQRRGVGGRGVSEVAGYQQAGSAGTVPGSAVQTQFQTDSKYSNGSNEIRIPPNFGWFKRYLPALQNFEIKYGWKSFEISINISYLNFSKFKNEFELKFKEVSMGRT
jgi:hypothetical protein